MRDLSCFVASDESPWGSRNPLTTLEEYVKAKVVPLPAVGACLALLLTGCGSGSSSSAPDVYTNDWAGVDRAIADCGRQYITPDQFPDTGSLESNARIYTTALDIVADCVLEKNPEYVCGQVDDGGLYGSVGCSYSDKTTTGHSISSNATVEQLLVDVGAYD